MHHSFRILVATSSTLHTFTCSIRTDLSFLEVTHSRSFSRESTPTQASEKAAQEKQESLYLQETSHEKSRNNHKMQKLQKTTTTQLSTTWNKKLIQAKRELVSSNCLACVFISNNESCSELVHPTKPGNSKEMSAKGGIRGKPAPHNTRCKFSPFALGVSLTGWHHVHFKLLSELIKHCLQGRCPAYVYSCCFNQLHFRE